MSRRRIGALVAAVTVIVSGCANTITGTAVPAGGGGGGGTTTSSAPPIRITPYSDSLLALSDFPTGTDYTVTTALTVKNIFPAITSAASKLVTNPPNCFLSPGISAESTAVDGAGVIAFKRPSSSDMVFQIVTSAASVPKDVLMKQVTGCSSFVVSSTDPTTPVSLSGFVVANDMTLDGITVTLVSRTIADGKGGSSYVDALVGYDKGAMTSITFTGSGSSNPGTKLIGALTTAGFGKLVAAK